MRYFLLSFFFVCFAYGVDEPASAPISQMVDLFQVSANPGRGVLSYKQNEEKTEKIELGQQTGFYGLGMVFSGRVLPDPFRKQLGQSQILQVVLGALKANEEKRLLQFSAVSLLSKKIPTEKTVFRVAPPSSFELKKGQVAILLFTSPTLKLPITDADKLRETLFAESGSLIVTPVGLKAVSKIKTATGDYSFFKQDMKMDWSVKLSTPFLNEKRSIVGSTQFPFYWPKDAESRKMVDRIARESLSLIANGLGESSLKK